MKKIFVLVIILIAIILLPTYIFAETTDANNDGYHDGDVAVINELIADFDLALTSDDPQSWPVIAEDGYGLE